MLRRHLVRFSLRDMLLLEVATAVPQGWLGWEVNKVRQQRVAAAELEKMDCNIEFSYATNGLDGLMKALGEDEPEDVEYVTT